MRAVLTFAAILVPLLALPAGAQQEVPRKQVLEGRVLAGPRATPVAGASVELVRLRGRRRGRGARAAPRPPGAAPTSSTLASTQTDAAGAFALPLPGERTRLGLFVRAEGFVRQFLPVPLRPGGPVEVTIQPARTLSGRLVDAASGRPLAGGRVRYQRQSVESDAEGRFTLGGLPQVFGDGAVEVSLEGYATQLLADPFGAQEPLVVRLERAAHLPVRVVDDRGRPLEGVRVRVRQPFAPPYSAAERRDVSGLTDADGCLTLRGLPPRAAFVAEATSEGGVTTQSPVVAPVPADGEGEPLVLRLGDLYRVAVRVIDGHGTPLAGADVRLLPLCERRQAFGGFSESDNSRGGHRFGRTDGEGRVSFERVPPSPLTCEVRMPRYETVLTLVSAGPPGEAPRETAVVLARDADPPGTQIPWGPGVAEGFERAAREGLPLMVQMTMDGERANDWIAGHHFKDPEVVRVARRIPILLASASAPAGSRPRASITAWRTACPRATAPSIPAFTRPSSAGPARRSSVRAASRSRARSS